MSEVSPPQGEWKNISCVAHLKGRRRDPKYYPAIGETCRMSGPNCDNADGYTWSEVEVLWTDELFVVTRTPGLWPAVTKHELVLFEPKLVDPLLIEARQLVADRYNDTFGAEYKAATLAGEDDDSDAIKNCLAALRRGIEIGEANHA